MVCVVKPHDVRPETCRPAGIEIMIDPLACTCDTEQADFFDPEVQETDVLCLHSTGREQR